MNNYLRYSISAIALLAAASLAHAQSAERQGPEKGAPSRCRATTKMLCGCRIA